MRFRLYMTQDGMVSAMDLAGSTAGDGTPMEDFHRKFDGSEVYHEFDIPPVPEEIDSDPAPQLTENQCFQMARVVCRAAGATACEAAVERPDDANLIDFLRGIIEAHDDAGGDNASSLIEQIQERIS